MEFLFYLIVSSTLSVVIRIIFLNTHSSDDWVTWYILKKLKTEKKIDHSNYDNVFPSYNGYPKLHYYTISLFPERYWSIIGNLSNIFYDLIVAVGVFLIAHYLFNDLRISFISATIFSTTPILMPVTARLFGIKARAMGGALSFAYFLCLGGFLMDENIYLAIMSSVFFVLSIMSSSFAMQNIIFITIIISVFYFNFLPCLLLILSIVVGYLIPSTGIRKILTHKWNHYLWYFKNQKGTTVEKRNRLKFFFLLPIYLFRKPKQFIDQVFRNQSFIIALYSIPGLFLIFYYNLVVGDGSIMYSQGSWIEYFFFLTVGSIIIFILTSLKPFLFLGQAERYFEYSSVFITILTIYYWTSLSRPLSDLLFLILFQISMVISNFIYIKKNEYARHFKDLTFLDKEKKLIDFLNSNSSIKRILSIPIKYSYKLAYYMKNSDKKYYFANQTTNANGFKNTLEDTIGYSLPTSELDQFKNKYDIDSLIVQNAILRTQQGKRYNNILIRKKKLFDNGEFSVYVL